MLVSLLVRLGITGVAFAVAASILAGMDVTGGFSSYLKIAIVFGVLNAIVGTVLRILTIPLTLLTFGLFAIVVNALLLELTDSLTRNLTIDAFFWTAVWAAIIIGLASAVLGGVLPDTRKKKR